MKQDQIGFEVLGEIRCAFCTAKEVDPYRSVDQNHCAPSRIGSRRREATSTSGTFPRSAANRLRAASSTSAFRPSRTATDLVGAPVTRTASSRRSRSISIVVLMHKASHESYAGSTATKSPPQSRLAATNRRGSRYEAGALPGARSSWRSTAAEAFPWVSRRRGRPSPPPDGAG